MAGDGRRKIGVLGVPASPFRLRRAGSPGYWPEKWPV